MKGFHLFSPVGANYQGGLLDNNVRITIQFIHRVGAVITALYLTLIAVFIVFRTKVKPLKISACILILLVSLQFLLGIMNVIYLLPIQVAVAHNGIAALLLATIFSMLHFTSRRSAYV